LESVLVNPTIVPEMRQFSRNGKETRYRNYVAGIPFIVQVTDQKSTLPSADTGSSTRMAVRSQSGGQRGLYESKLRGLVINETTRYIFGTK